MTTEQTLASGYSKVGKKLTHEFKSEGFYSAAEK
jgi:hypothetical protein